MKVIGCLHIAIPAPEHLHEVEPFQFPHITLLYDLLVSDIIFSQLYQDSILNEWQPVTPPVFECVCVKGK